MSAVVAVKSGRALARRRARRRLTARPLSVLGLVGVVVVILVAIFANWVAPYDPALPDFTRVLAPPGTPGHLLGTDQLGRDALSRLLYGARTTLLAGVLATVLGTVVAVPIGLVAGYFRGWVDVVITRIVDVVLAFPFLVFAVGLAAIFGPSLRNVVLALGVAQVPGVIRVVRAEVFAQRELEYVQAEVVNGTPTGTIMFRHILPNVLNPVVVQASVAVPVTIIGAAILSFLGLGVQPPTADWGTMLSDAENYLGQAPWLGIFPGIAIFLTTLCFNLFGDALRDALDPTGR